MKLTDLNANAFVYGIELTETAQSLVELFLKVKKQIQREIDNGDDHSIKKSIEDFKEKYEKPLVTLATLILIHNRLKNRDTDEGLATVMSSGISTLVHGNNDQSIKALDAIRTELEYNDKDKEKPNPSESKLKRFYNSELIGRKNIIQDGYKGVDNGKYENFMDSLNALLAVPTKYAAAFDKYHTSIKAKDGEIIKDGEKVSSLEELEKASESLKMPLDSTRKLIKEAKDNILESLDIITDCGYLEESDLFESESEDAKNTKYFMFIELSVHTEQKPVSGLPHKHYCVTIGTVAKNVDHARKNIESQVKKSLKDLNKKLKSMKVEVVIKDKSQFKTGRVYEGVETILDKNIKSLTRVDKISSGVWFLDGIEGNGNIGDIKYAVNGTASLSKTSITRHLNKVINESLIMESKKLTNILSTYSTSEITSDKIDEVMKVAKVAGQATWNMLTKRDGVERVEAEKCYNDCVKKIMDMLEVNQKIAKDVLNHALSELDDD